MFPGERRIIAAHKPRSNQTTHSQRTANTSAGQDYYHDDSRVMIIIAFITYFPDTLYPRGFRIPILLLLPLFLVLVLGALVAAQITANDLFGKKLRCFDQVVASFND